MTGRADHPPDHDDDAAPAGHGSAAVESITGERDDVERLHHGLVRGSSTVAFLNPVSPWIATTSIDAQKARP